MVTSAINIWDYEEIQRLCSLTEDEWYDELMLSLGLRKCVLLFKKKKVKNKTLYKRIIKEVRI